MKYYLVSAENPEIRKTIQVPDEIVPTKTPVKAPVKIKAPIKTPNVSPVKSPLKTAKSIKAVQQTRSALKWTDT